MAAGGKVILRFLWLQSVVLGALCCTCMDYPLQKHFCDHEYVMKVVVKGFKYMAQKTRYEVELIELFKGDRRKLDFQNGTNVFVFMPNYCLLDFVYAGDVFAIFGFFTEGNIYTDRCSGSEIWNLTSETFRNNVNTEIYKLGCNCKFRPDRYGKCPWSY